MRGNVYLKTLADLRGQILVWSAGLIGIAAANVLLFPTVQSFPGLISFLDSMPPAFKAMVGDVQSMAQLEGFLRVKLFEPLPLLLAIFAVGQGAGLIAGEVEAKSMDLLLSRPVPRWRVVAGKFLALVTATILMTGSMAVGVVVCAKIIGADITSSYVVKSSANGLPLTWVFGALALLGSVITLRSRTAAVAVGVLVVASFTFETLRLLSPVLRPWTSVSLFAQQKAGVALDGAVDPGSIVMLLLVAVVVAAGAAAVFERRDLTVG